MRRLLYLWSLPMGIVGLLAAAIFAPLGWIQASSWCDGALWIGVQGPLADRLRHRRWAAFTLGWTVFEWDAVNASLEVLNHEREHLRQCLAWGPAYWPAYLICLLFQGYHNNYFEVQARKAEGR